MTAVRTTPSSLELSAMPRSRRLPRLIALAVALVVTGTGLTGLTVSAANAASYVPISGAGSTWSQNAIDQWRRNVNQYGMKINYQGTGSSDGRNQFRNGTVDFAVSEIPFGLSDGGTTDTPPSRGYAYMPIVAGGTSFMYNLKIGGRRVTNLRLSGKNIARIFTGQVKRWNDPALQADNPGLQLPARAVVPVVRSDGSGTTAQFSTYLAKRYQSDWDAYCQSAGRSTPCGTTSNFPVAAGKGFVAQSGSLGVSGYVAQAQSEGAITYVEYSYALNSGFPVAKMLNTAGYYVEPTPSNVAVALLKAQINTDRSSSQYLTQILDGVYTNGDSRAYPLSSYSYMIIPTKAEQTFNESKGHTLGDFAYYFLCEGQQQAPVLGFSPLPINLVQAGLDQVRKIPGVTAQNIDINKCNNPTFSPSGENTLAKNAPPPQTCDKQGSTQCTNGTGGAQQTTASSAGAPAQARAATTTAGAGAPPGAAAALGGSPGGSGQAVGATSPLGTSTAPLGTATTINPETGAVVAAPQTAVAGGAAVAAVPLSLTDGSTGASANALMAVAGLVLLLVTLLPPMLLRRLRDTDAS
ncbi:MAG: phosphate ABC transporter substrate-binding protein PstS [Mycobacteriales bacterium]